MQYVVFKEIHNNNSMERWFWGLYDNKSIANEVAYEVSPHGDGGVWASICPLDEAKDWGVKNLPYGI